MDGILKNRDRAMTLMEILIVIALIAVLAGVGISNMGGVLDSGKKKAAKAFLESTVRAACNALYAKMDYNDTNVKAEIKDITTDANTPITDLKGLATFFDSTTPLDPWGAPWKFSYADKSDKNVIGPTLKVESSNGDKGNYTFVNGKITVDIIPKA